MRPKYGRDARIRSCAFFIFDAATISMALVILRVLCTLLILLRISFEPAIGAALLECSVLFEVVDRRSERCLGLRIEILGLLDLVDKSGVFAFDELTQPRFE